MQCAAHPNVETELGCSRCGKAICSRCLVHTPVGARCEDCANVRRAVTYSISPDQYVRGIAAALFVGVATGVAWWFFNREFFYGGLFLRLLFGLGIGLAAGEAVAWATNRRAGRPLQFIAIGGVILAYAVRAWLLVSVDNWTFEVFRQFDEWAVVAAGVGAFVAWQRVR
jgi:hypothetical protein